MKLSNRSWLTIIFALLVVVVSVTLIKMNTEMELLSAQIQLEDEQAENAKLWVSVETLQTEIAAIKSTPTYIYRNVCSTSIFKSYMDFRTITNHSSTQWKLQQVATTDKNFGVRLIDNKYIMVAMSAQYGPVGTKYLISFDSGKSINAIVGEQKQEPCQASDGSMIEFIIDVAVTPKSILRSGNFNDVFQGSITSIMAIE